MSEPIKAVAMSFGELLIKTAVEGEVEEISALHALAAEKLTRVYGRGHWSSPPKAPAVLRGITTSRTVCACCNGRIVGTYQLATKKPWAIDLSYFTPAERPVYLHSMAVLPAMQAKGIGRALVADALQRATDTGVDAIRLDAYDSPAGAGGFYSRCGFRERGRKVYRSVPLAYFECLCR